MVTDLYKKPIWQTVWFALGVCLVLLGLSLIPSVSQWIQSIDQRCAVWFNNLAGDSPVFDRFILLVTDEDGRERITLLAIIWFLIVLWLTPSRVEKSRLLGTLLFITIVVLLYLMVDSLLDDIIERKSPSMEFLQPFHNIGKILDFKVDLKDKRTFPNFEAMILFTMGFIMLRLRRYRGGLIALALGATIPLFFCIAGLCWVSDIFLGALPLSLLVSAMAMETPFNLIYTYLVDMSAAAIDQRERFARNLRPMWRHRRLYWLSKNVFHMEVAVKRFVSRDLTAILDKENQYQNETIQLEIPLGGLKSVVRIVTLGPLKAVLRAYPINKRFEAEQHFQASKLLKKFGVRVPAIYYKTENPRNFGAIFLVEEFIDGRSKPPAEVTDEDLAAAGREMARLHNVKNKVWGQVKSPRTEDYGTVLLRRIDRQLGQVARGPILKSQQHQVARVRSWFAEWRNQLTGIRSFSLVHGKMHRENCIFETCGRFCLLDITTLEWGIAASDLVIVHNSQCGGRPDLIAKLDEAYFNELSPEDVKTTRHLLLLYEAIHCLGQVSKYTKRLSRTHRKPINDATVKGLKWWNRLIDIVEKSNVDSQNS